LSIAQVVWLALNDDQRASLEAMPRLPLEDQVAARASRVDNARAKRAEKEATEMEAQEAALDELRAERDLAQSKHQKYKRRAVRRSRRNLLPEDNSEAESSSTSTADGSSTSDGCEVEP
jgi:hypothetical protein